jgi:uncharacterized protein YcbK (DUF882 family)
MSTYTYFTDEEVKGLDPELCTLLDHARGMAGVPFLITSGLRSEADNALLPEAVKESSHITGQAVDLRCADSLTRFLMLKALYSVGFKRLGIYSAHIHADVSTTLPQNVCWFVEGT